MPGISRNKGKPINFYFIKYLKTNLKEGSCEGRCPFLAFYFAIR